MKYYCLPKLKPFIIILLTTVLLSSCDNNQSEPTCDTISDVDVFVNSEKFEQLQKVLETDFRTFRFAYNTLSNEEKRKFKSLQEKGRNLKGEEKINVTKEIGKLLGIDYEERIKILTTAIDSCYRGVNYSELDIAKALRKKKMNAKTRSTEESQELQYQHCVDNCEYNYIRTGKTCYTHYTETVMIPSDTGGGLEYEVIYSDKYEECMTNAYYERMDCLSSCEWIK